MLKNAASRAIIMFVFFTVVCGLVYTLVMTGISQLVFNRQANGSLITGNDGVTYGSELIGQTYTDDGHLWGRPQSLSVVDTPDGEQAIYSGPSNISPASDDYAATIQERVEAVQAANPDASGPVPEDLVTESGSGLDPQISPAAAEYQVPRIAKATGKSEDEVRSIIEKCTSGRVLGVFGEPTVNVLKVNLMLDGKLDA